MYHTCWSVLHASSAPDMSAPMYCLEGLLLIQASTDDTKTNKVVLLYNYGIAPHSVLPLGLPWK